MPLTSLPTREPGNTSPTGIGGPKNNARPLIEARRHEKIPADELNRTLDYICQLALEVGLTDGSTAGSLRQAISASSGVVYQDASGDAIVGDPTTILRMTGLSGTATITAPAIGGAGKSIALLLADASTEQVIFSAPGTSINGGGFTLALPGSETGTRRAWYAYGRGAAWTVIGYATYAELLTAQVRPVEKIVGNALEGDTLAQCDYLDPGDGSGILAAANALYGLRGSIIARRGLYTMPATSAAIVLSSPIHLRGEGRNATRIRVRAGDAATRPWLGVQLSGGDACISDLTFEVPARAATIPALTGPLGVISVEVPNVQVRRVTVVLIDDIEAASQPLSAIDFLTPSALGGQVFEDVTFDCSGIFVTGHATNALALAGVTCGTFTGSPQLAGALTVGVADPLFSRFRLLGGQNDDAASPPFFTLGVAPTQHSQFRLDNCEFHQCFSAFLGSWTSAAGTVYAKGPWITNMRVYGPDLGPSAIFSGVTININQSGGTLFMDRIRVDSADIDGGSAGSHPAGIKVGSNAARLRGVEITNAHVLARSATSAAVISLSVGAGGESPRIQGCTLDTDGSGADCAMEVLSASRARVIDNTTNTLDIGAGSTNAIVAANHVRTGGGYTDVGTGTSLGGGNIVG